MSQTATITGKPGGKFTTPASDPMVLLRSSGVLIPVIVVGVALVAVFWRLLLKQYQPHLPWLNWSFLEPLGGYSWQKPEDWGHAYMVPIVSLYALHRDRFLLSRAERFAFWPGLLAVVLGVVMYVYFIVGFSNHMFQGFAAVLTLAGVCLLLLGPRVFGILVFPLLYLLFAVTISESVMNKLTYRLQDIAAQGAWVVLNMFGVDTDLGGNVLTMHDSTGAALPPMNVAQACSGMRMVIAFMALAGAMGFLSCAFWWQRIALFMLGVPTAVLMNIMRVACLGFLSLINPNFASGEAHAFVGNLLLVPAFFLFLGVAWALKRIAPAPGTVKSVSKAKGGAA